MHTRDREGKAPITFYGKLLGNANAIGKGTAIGIVGRYSTWHFEKAYYEASSKLNKKSYGQIYRDTFFRRESWKQLNNAFWKTGFWQTVGKSASNNGVVGYVEYAYPGLNPMQSGLLTAAFMTPLETVVTSHGEYKKVQAFLAMQKQATVSAIENNDRMTPARRVLASSFVRIGFTSFITFGSIYQTADWLRKLSPDTSDAVIKPTAALLASFFIQPLNMPFINFQTYMLSDPVKNTALAFYQQHTATDMLRGGLGRSINRAVYYGLTFFMNEMVKEKKPQAADLAVAEEKKRRLS